MRRAAHSPPPHPNLTPIHTTVNSALALLARLSLVQCSLILSTFCSAPLAAVIPRHTVEIPLADFAWKTIHRTLAKMLPTTQVLHLPLVVHSYPPPYPSALPPFFS